MSKANREEKLYDLKKNCTKRVFVKNFNMLVTFLKKECFFFNNLFGEFMIFLNIFL